MQNMLHRVVRNTTQEARTHQDTNLTTTFSRMDCSYLLINDYSCYIDRRNSMVIVSIGVILSLVFIIVTQGAQI
jgi:hypothetical protein